MRKTILSLGLAVILCAAAGSASALTMPAIPGKTIPKLPDPVIQIEPIKYPIGGIEMVIDPILLPDLSPATSSGPIQIDPGILGKLKPLPLGEFVIPPELLKGPQISDIALSTDGKLLQITWTTNKVATSKVEYGTTVSYGKLLEDKTQVTQHSLLVPTAPGELHLKISSADAAGKVSASEDIAVTIPEMQPSDEQTATESTSTEETAVIAQDEPTEAAKPQDTLLVTAEPPTVQVQTGPSNMTLVGGALALLIIGVLVGALVSRGKKPSEPKPEQK
jgi:hypothetical protein